MLVPRSVVMDLILTVNFHKKMINCVSFLLYICVVLDVECVGICWMVIGDYMLSTSVPCQLK